MPRPASAGICPSEGPQRLSECRFCPIPKSIVRGDPRKKSINHVQAHQLTAPKAVGAQVVIITGGSCGYSEEHFPQPGHQKVGKPGDRCQK